MNKELERRLKVLRPLFMKMKCQQHPAYCASHFCTRPQCGFGLLCSACEELEHAGLRHQSLDGLGIDHLKEAQQFIEEVFGRGLHYEEKESLVPDISTQDFNMLLETSSKFEKMKEKQIQELEDQLSSLQKESLTKLELRFKKLRRDLLEELNKAFEKETRPLNYVCQALDNLFKKREVSLERLITELEFAKLAPSHTTTSSSTKMRDEEAGLDMQKCSLAFQAHLEATYNRLDVEYMSDARKAADYLRAGEPHVKVDLSKLKDLISNGLLTDLEQAFEKISEISTIESGGLENLLGRSSYLDNLGKNISSRYVHAGEAKSKTEVDKRVRLAADSSITAVCSFADRLVVVGFQSGVIKVAALHWRPSTAEFLLRLSSPKA